MPQRDVKPLAKLVLGLFLQLFFSHGILYNFFFTIFDSFSNLRISALLLKSFRFVPFFQLALMPSTQSNQHHPALDRCYNLHITFNLAARFPAY